MRGGARGRMRRGHASRAPRGTAGDELRGLSQVALRRKEQRRRDAGDHGAGLRRGERPLRRIHQIAGDRGCDGRNHRRRRPRSVADVVSVRLRGDAALHVSCCATTAGRSRSGVAPEGSGAGRIPAEDFARYVSIRMPEADEGLRAEAVTIDRIAERHIDTRVRIDGVHFRRRARNGATPTRRRAGA